MNQVLLRFAFWRIAFVVTVILVAMSIPPRHAVAGTEGLRVASALFTPSRSSGALSWAAEWVLTPESRDALLEAPSSLRFAVPLPAAAALEVGPGLAPIVVDERVVGVTVSASALDGRKVRATVHQREALRGGVEGGLLAAPFATGTALQMARTELERGARLDIEDNGTLERRVGHWSPVGVGRAAREEAARLTGHSPRIGEMVVYARGDDVRASSGLHGRVVTAEVRGHGSAVAVGLGFVVIVLSLIVAWRRLQARACVERADAILAAEFFF